jgi:hypothetical protein
VNRDADVEQMFPDRSRRWSRRCWVLALLLNAVGIVLLMINMSTPTTALRITPTGVWTYAGCLLFLLSAEYLLAAARTRVASWLLLLVGFFTLPIGVCFLAAGLAAGVSGFLGPVFRPRPSTQRCVKCGYDLQGLTLPRCPECGCLVGFDKTLTELGLSEAELRAYAAAKQARQGEPSTVSSDENGERRTPDQ